MKVCTSAVKIPCSLRWRICEVLSYLIRARIVDQRVRTPHRLAPSGGRPTAASHAGCSRGHVQDLFMLSFPLRLNLDFTPVKLKFLLNFIPVSGYLDLHASLCIVLVAVSLAR